MELYFVADASLEWQVFQFTIFTCYFFGLIEIVGNFYYQEENLNIYRILYRVDLMFYQLRFKFSYKYVSMLQIGVTVIGLMSFPSSIALYGLIKENHNKLSSLGVLSFVYCYFINAIPFFYYFLTVTVIGVRFFYLNKCLKNLERFAGNKLVALDAIIKIHWNLIEATKDVNQAFSVILLSNCITIFLVYLSILVTVIINSEMKLEFYILLLFNGMPLITTIITAEVALLQVCPLKAFCCPANFVRYRVRKRKY